MRLLRYVGLFGSAAIFAITACGLHHASRSAQERSTFAAPGRIVPVVVKLHINCVGNGSPIVVLESGAGASSNVWALVQRTVAQHTRVCSYDRAGFGWSDDPPHDRPYDRIEALRALLTLAGETGRFVFVGHSLGGEYVRIYAYEHPEDVAALVLIATSHPDARRRDPALKGMSEGPHTIQRLMPLVAATGLFRFWPESFLPAIYSDYLNTLRKLPPASAEAELAFIRQTRYHRAVLAEMESLVDMQSRNEAARTFGDTLLIVISERWDPDPADSTEVTSARIADELQTELVGFSKKGRRITLDGGHVLPITRSEQVSKAILEVLAESREASTSL